MNIYTYTDNKDKTKKIVGVFLAENIVEADKMLKEKTGIDAVKAPHIGCKIEFGKTDIVSESSFSIGD